MPRSTTPVAHATEAKVCKNLPAAGPNFPKVVITRGTIVAPCKTCFSRLRVSNFLNKLLVIYSHRQLLCVHNRLIRHAIYHLPARKCSDDAQLYSIKLRILADSEGPSIVVSAALAHEASFSRLAGLLHAGRFAACTPFSLQTTSQFFPGAVPNAALS
jgi:hypothetical protein